MKVTKEKRKVNVIMGMAAGQARLLSITSRMSDNELRAQLINNDKMRLATKSAQVSDAYTTALNEAQLMFTNYDKDNNTSYKELTFNSLTAYNQYNNQYAISNSAGQLLVSETDATNFQKSADLEAFLKCYGLEQTTTYFNETLTKYQGIKYNVLNKDDIAVDSELPSNGVIYNTDLIYPDINGVSKTIQIDSGWTAEELQKIYEGTDGYEGYQNIKTSPEYYEYTGAVASFETAQSVFETSIAEKANELLSKGSVKVDDKPYYLTTDGSEKGKNLTNLNQELSQLDPDSSGAINSAISTIDDILKVINNMKGYSKSDTATQDYYKKQEDLLNNVKIGNLVVDHSDITWDAENKTLTYDGLSLTKDAGGQWSGTMTTENEAGEPTTTNITSTIVSNGMIKIQYTDTAGNTSTITIPDPTNAKNLDANGNLIEDGLIEQAPDAEAMVTVGQQVITSLKDSFIKNISTDSEIFKGSQEYKNYETAARNLYKVIYGSDANFGNLDSDKWSSLTNVNEIENLGQTFTKGTDANGNDVDYAAKFQKIKQVTILDYIMDTYGEPKYDWIDTSNKNASYNENGSAKAQWYTNLYNKMNTSGYKALQDGLASSSEWIKFAFESGLVCLEQVDANNNWNSTTYTNCSDITEQTNNAAITKAEAEYNAAMAKIENKDKRYDLELKNIDTEHNSLQTEYDSIKTAIDKNIERTFKIYS